MENAMDENMRISPIGVIRSPLTDPGDAPKQGSEAAIEGKLVVDESYRDGLLGLQPGQKAVILYWMHQAERDRLQVNPRGDLSRPLRGVFSTRSQHRPNPIAIATVEVLDIDGTTLLVRGLDAVDGTPLLDIKSTWEK
jgi:L-fuculose-phosphate aldolase